MIRRADPSRFVRGGAVADASIRSAVEELRSSTMPTATSRRARSIRAYGRGSALCPARSSTSASIVPSMSTSSPSRTRRTSTRPMSAMCSSSPVIRRSVADSPDTLASRSAALFARCGTSSRSVTQPGRYRRPIPSHSGYR